MKPGFWLGLQAAAQGIYAGIGSPIAYPRSAEDGNMWIKVTDVNLDRPVGESFVDGQGLEIRAENVVHGLDARSSYFEKKV